MVLWAEGESVYFTHHIQHLDLVSFPILIYSPFFTLQDFFIISLCIICIGNAKGISPSNHSAINLIKNHAYQFSPSCILALACLLRSCCCWLSHVPSLTAMYPIISKFEEKIAWYIYYNICGSCHGNDGIHFAHISMNYTISKSEE